MSFGIRTYYLDKIKRRPDKVITCPKCKHISGDDWSQCIGSCPMPMSPHYVGEQEMKRRATFTVSLTLRDDCDPEYALECLTNHVSALGGDLRPPGALGETDDGDPMCSVGHEFHPDVTLHSIRKVK